MVIGVVIWSKLIIKKGIPNLFSVTHQVGPMWSCHTPTFCSLGSIQIGHKYTDDTHLYTISFGRLNCQTTFPLSNIHLPSTEVYPSRWLVVLWQLCEADLNSSQSSDEFNLELNQIILPCHHKIPPNSSACLQHVSIARYEILIYHCNPHRLHNSSTYLAALILTLQTNGVVPTQVLLSEN